MLIHQQPSVAESTWSDIEEDIETARELWRANDLDRATELILKSKQRLEKKPNKRLQVYYHFARCQILFSNSEYEEGVKNNEVGLALPYADDFPQHKANLMLCHAKTLERAGDTEKSIALLDETHAFSIDRNLTKEQSVSLFLKAQYLADLGNSREALTLLDRADKISRSIDDHEGLSNILNAMANILYYENNCEKAIEYYNEIAEMSQSDPFQLSTVFFNIGNCLFNLNQFEKARNFFEKSLNNSEIIDDTPGVGYAKLGLAKVSLAQEKFRESLLLLNQAKNIFGTLNMKNQSAQVEGFLGHNFHEQKKYEIAEKHFQTALTHYTEANIKPGIQAMKKALSSNYAMQNRFKQAYGALIEYNELFQEQITNNKEKEIAKMQVLFDSEKKEFKNKLLAQELTLQADIIEQAKLQYRLQTGLLLTLGLIIVLMCFLIRKHIRHKEVYRLLSQTDELTKLNNRSHIIQITEDHFEQFKRYRTPMTLLLFDIDHFKQFNDRFGHDIGDRVLKKVARAAAASIRKTDHIGRYGGEEFLVLLSNTRRDEAFDVAERIRLAIESIVVDEVISNKRITISIGGAEATNAHLSLEQTVKEADITLYEAKSLGRNRTQFSENDR